MNLRNALSSALLASFVLSVNASAALAQGSDPTKVGDNAKDIILPNAKAIWWICLVCGLLYAAASRKAGRAGGIIGGLLLSGIVIYNPGGVASFMQGIANQIV
jgi:ribulose 1,5-bisphosphate synthetase/thiazole synthase